MSTQFCVTGSEGGIVEECGMKVLKGGVEGRERRNFSVLFFRGVLGERQGRQTVKGETRDGKWEGQARTTYTLMLPPVDGFWALTCWGV